MLEDLSVQGILNNIKDRTVSMKEVAEYYLDRIDKYNPQLNAIVLQKDRELIIKEAISKWSIYYLTLENSFSFQLVHEYFLANIVIRIG